MKLDPKDIPNGLEMFVGLVLAFATSIAVIFIVGFCVASLIELYHSLK